MKIQNVFLYFILTLSNMLFSASSQASGLTCSQLFEKTFKVNDFIIEVKGKSKSTDQIAAAHENLINNTDILYIHQTLEEISEFGITLLSNEQKQTIVKFRQDSSFLRSIFQTSSKKHESPKQFANFVRDFGHLKDMILIGEGEQAQKAASKILTKYSDLDLEKIVRDTKPASKKSVKKYFEEIIEETEMIMQKQTMTVDELHDVRKNLRDILRYLQIQNELKAEKNGLTKADFGQDIGSQDTLQIDFLKKLNKKLGVICDDYAGQIIRKQITDKTLVTFPENLRARVEHFLNNYQIIVN